MNAKQSSSFWNAFSYCMPLPWLGLIAMFCFPCLAQEEPERANISSSIGNDGSGSIIVEARGKLPEPPVFFTASAQAVVQVTTQRLEQVIQLTIKVIQGNAKTLSLGIHGAGDVTEVQGTSLRSWSVRQEGPERFLDLHLQESVKDLKVEVKLNSRPWTLPATLELPHLTAGKSVGFDSILDINYAQGLQATVQTVEGFVALNASDRTRRFQTSTGGRIQLSINRDGTAAAPVELVGTTLTGQVQSDGSSIGFQLSSSAHVTEPNAEITILSGNAAVRQIPTDPNYRLRLSFDGERPVYKLVFPTAGTFTVTLDFVATLTTPEINWLSMDFSVAASAVVPLTLTGLEADLEFRRDQESVVPLHEADAWLGFLPASGRAKLQWKAARKASEGKLFFTTTGYVETQVGAGLMRQDHQIDYQVLQGELKTISILLQGPGEILDVQGKNIVSWKVVEAGADRRLDATLSQPITGESQIKVRSQTPLGAFPVRAEGLRLNPTGAIRHSGYLRLSNLGSVRLEPTGLSGLTQLAPDQFPGNAIEARQVFVYRFPSAEHGFTVAANRIQPEVNISELVLYELTETDRVITVDIELDIREAPIREWDFGIPSDYSVVSITGASVADYIAATEAADNHRNLKVIFSQDVTGRQLVTLRLEKSEAVAEGDWALPRIEFPGAKTMRGDIGVMGNPGIRIGVGTTDLLVEKPLSYFPKPTATLQQSFRIREPGWSGTMQIELLDRSVQADVLHLSSLSDETVYGSALINYFVTGSPVSEWQIAAPENLANLMVDGQDVRTWRREGGTLIVSLHRPVMGAYTLLVTFEEKPDKVTGHFGAGQIAPIGVQGERGYIQVVSPMQVDLSTVSVSNDLLQLDPLELPAEFRLLSTAAPLGTWQYTQRPFDLTLKVDWFQPGTTVAQVVEFSEANSRVSKDGELVTDVLYFIKSRGQRTLKIKLPAEPVRLWEVSVNGQPVTARKAEDALLIPLPGGTDPNIPVEVSLRLGKPTISESNPELTLPIVFAPILKTQWNVVGDEKHVLVPSGGTVTPSMSVLRPSGFDWVAKQGIVPLILIGLFSGIGIWGCSKTGFFQVVGLLGLAIAMWVSLSTASIAFSQTGAPLPLQLSLPILSAGETVELQVQNIPLWRVNLSWPGLATFLLGIAAFAWSITSKSITSNLPRLRMLARCAGLLLVALGVLLQGDGAPLFYALLALAILILLFVPPTWDWIRRLPNWLSSLAEQHQQSKASEQTVPPEAFSPITPTLLLFALMVSSASTSLAAVSDGFEAADAIRQQWHITHRDARLSATGTITLTGRPGDRFLLLRAPAVLTRFEGAGLRLSKREVPGEGLTYIVNIAVPDEAPELDEDANAAAAVVSFQATFEYQLEALKPIGGMPVLTGTAAVQEISLSYDEAGWDVLSPTAVQVEPIDGTEGTQAKVLLGPGRASLFLKPKARDVTTEETQFFVEASNLYLPGPGVVDGRHHLHIRPSQGQVGDLNVLVPQGLTVSAVSGPVGSWQFDADSGRLRLDIEPSQSQAFDVLIETQRGLDPLPADVSLAPLKVEATFGEVGLLGIAFGPEAQPEKLEPTGMSAVNLGDFDSSLIANRPAVLHRVYRYGAEGGTLLARVAPVESEVRVVSQQVLSLGDERIVLGVNFTAEISRAGLFQLSFPLPNGLEVESLTGAALHHWAELTEDNQRQIILHLNGKTIGTQSFSLALTGAAPTAVGDWEIPRFELKEASRHTGELVVRPTTGIRLSTVSRQNVSETDPRVLGGEAPGSLAFRLLQPDWTLVLGIEQLDPWITGQVLHEVTLREGQTRSALIANFQVQNASIRALQVTLPVKDEDEIKTLRASGDTVSDFVRTAADSNIWEVQFKRRVVGKIQFQIEYERRGDRANENETLSPAGFPQARQLSYYFAVRAGGRLELEHTSPSDAWQPVDWGTVPSNLREALNRNAPVFVLRSVAPVNSLIIHATRHSLADALKLRVAQGSLTTILSPTGDQLTAVDATIEVIQRSSLRVGLPQGGELFSIFVNGESVNSIRLGGTANAWQFTILPGIDDRQAQVRFVYSVTGNGLSPLKLTSPQMNVPLENIQWNVVAPKGFELIDHDGNLELISHSSQDKYDRDSYLSKASGKRKVQAQQATQLLEQANQLLQAGEQTKARWALNSVANQYALDAASNEDARVQLENLQTQQAIVGLNARRQRLYLDNHRNDTASLDDKQLREAAADNPILQQDQLNFRPQQLSQLLRGNTTEDNAVLQQIAGRLVQHQRTTEPAPQAILISLPEEGSIYTFSRSVQVTENEALQLDLNFGLERRLHPWPAAAVLALLAAMAVGLALTKK